MRTRVCARLFFDLHQRVQHASRATILARATSPSHGRRRRDGSATQPTTCLACTCDRCNAGDDGCPDLPLGYPRDAFSLWRPAARSATLSPTVRSARAVSVQHTAVAISRRRRHHRDPRGPQAHAAACRSAGAAADDEYRRTSGCTASRGWPLRFPCACTTAALAGSTCNGEVRPGARCPHFHALVVSDPAQAAPACSCARSRHAFDSAAG